MKGLKIRVPETALWRRTFELMGASPTPLPFPEVFQALKSKHHRRAGEPDRPDLQRRHLRREHASVAHRAHDAGQLPRHGRGVVPAPLARRRRRMSTKPPATSEAELRPKVEADDRRILEEVKQKKIVISEVDKEAFRKSVAEARRGVPGRQAMGRAHRHDRLIRREAPLRAHAPAGERSDARCSSPGCAT